jgi:NAD(P)-dependent dehydrogenase (short-subunit alcohol dehydrogenase family)
VFSNTLKPNQHLNLKHHHTPTIAMASVLITGASRGFGLALTREFVSRPPSNIGKIFATARGNSAALKELAQKFPGRVVLVELDVTNQDSIKEAAAKVETKLGGQGLDILINNAGVCQYASGGVSTM